MLTQVKKAEKLAIIGAIDLWQRGMEELRRADLAIDP